MRTLKATVYRVIGGEKVALASLSPISREAAAEYHWFADRDDWKFDSVSKDLPIVSGTTQASDSGDTAPAWHVHYACRHCSGEHNFDLDLDDPNPRLATCDSASPDDCSLVEWTPPRSAV